MLISNKKNDLWISSLRAYRMKTKDVDCQQNQKTYVQFLTAVPEEF